MKTFNIYLKQSLSNQPGGGLILLDKKVPGTYDCAIGKVIEVWDSICQIFDKDRVVTYRFDKWFKDTQGRNCCFITGDGVTIAMIQENHPIIEK